MGAARRATVARFLCPCESSGVLSKADLTGSRPPWVLPGVQLSSFLPSPWKVQRRGAPRGPSETSHIFGAARPAIVAIVFCP